MRLLPLSWLIGCTGDSVELPPTNDSAEPTGVVPCDVPCVRPSAGEYLAFHRLRIDDDGAAWVSWVETSGPLDRRLYVARSAAPGAAFDAMIAVDTPEPPITGGSEKPSLAVHGDRIALAYTGDGVLRHGDAIAAYLQLGTIDADGATFDGAVQIDASDGGQWVLEQAHVTFTAAGEAWVSWKRQQYGIRDIATWARESTGLTPETVSDALSQSHDCSPPDLQRGSGELPFLAMRSNVGGLLQTVVLPAGEPVQITNSNWEYTDLVCPEDGPRVASIGDDWVATWVAPIPDGSVWRSFASFSADGGSTWTEPDHAHDADPGLGERFPSVTATPDGFLMSIESIHGTTRTVSLDGLAPPTEAAALSAPDELALVEVELGSGAGRTAALGRGDDGVLYLVEIPR